MAREIVIRIDTNLQLVTSDLARFQSQTGQTINTIQALEQAITDLTRERRRLDVNSDAYEQLSVRLVEARNRLRELETEFQNVRLDEVIADFLRFNDVNDSIEITATSVRDLTTLLTTLQQRLDLENVGTDSFNRLSGAIGEVTTRLRLAREEQERLTRAPISQDIQEQIRLFRELGQVNVAGQTLNDLRELERTLVILQGQTQIGSNEFEEFNAQLAEVRTQLQAIEQSRGPVSLIQQFGALAQVMSGVLATSTGIAATFGAIGGAQSQQALVALFALQQAFETLSQVFTDRTFTSLNRILSNFTQFFKTLLNRTAVFAATFLAIFSPIPLAIFNRFRTQFLAIGALFASTSGIVTDVVKEVSEEFIALYTSIRNGISDIISRFINLNAFTKTLAASFRILGTAIQAALVATGVLAIIALLGALTLELEYVKVLFDDLLDTFQLTKEIADSVSKTFGGWGNLLRASLRTGAKAIFEFAKFVGDTLRNPFNALQNWDNFTKAVGEAWVNNVQFVIERSNLRKQIQDIQLDLSKLILDGADDLLKARNSYDLANKEFELFAKEQEKIFKGIVDVTALSVDELQKLYEGLIPGSDSEKAFREAFSSLLEARRTLLEAETNYAREVADTNTQIFFNTLESNSSLLQSSTDNNLKILQNNRRQLNEQLERTRLDLAQEESLLAEEGINLIQAQTDPRADRYRELLEQQRDFENQITINANETSRELQAITQRRYTQRITDIEQANKLELDALKRSGASQVELLEEQNKDTEDLIRESGARIAELEEEALNSKFDIDLVELEAERDKYEALQNIIRNNEQKIKEIRLDSLLETTIAANEFNDKVFQSRIENERALLALSRPLTIQDEIEQLEKDYDLIIASIQNKIATEEQNILALEERLLDTTLTDREREALEQRVRESVLNIADLNSQLTQEQERFFNNLDDLTDSRFEERIQLYEDLVSGVVDIIGSLFDALDSQSRARLDEFRDTLKEVDSELQNVRSDLESLEEDLSEAQGERRKQLLDQIKDQRNAERALANEKIKLEKQIEAEEKKQQNRRKVMAISQAIVDASLVILNALKTQPFIPAGLIAASIAGAVTAAQIASITAQPTFAKGGVLEGASHSKGGIPILLKNRFVEAEGGEVIINKKSAAAFRPLLSEINSYKNWGKKFQDGGVLDLNDMSINASEKTNGINKTNDISNSELLQSIEKITIVTDVQEVTTAQDNVVEIRNNARL